MEHLTDDQVVDLLTGNEAEIIQQMEDVFVDYHNSKASMVPKIYLTNEDGDYRAMPAQWDHISGVKWISVYPKNYKHNLPTIHGTLLLNNTSTGEPIVSMDCAKLTAYRTAAVSALAVKHCTLSNTHRTVTFIGCGYQAKLHAIMYNCVMENLEVIKLYDSSRDNAFKFRQWLIDNNIGGEHRVPPHVCDSVKSACYDSEIITTLTPATKPYLRPEHVSSAAHINAIGADAVGKRELTEEICTNGQMIVDDYEQASHSGEMQYVSSLPYQTLGHIIGNGIVESGRNLFLTNKQTIFDSTGLAIEDIALGKFIYEQYCKRN